MAGFKNVLHWEGQAAKSLIVGDIKVTPYSQAITLSLPFTRLIWNRPVSIKVEQGEEINTIPIVDVTRVAQFSLFFAGTVATFILWLLSRRHTRQ